MNQTALLTALLLIGVFGVGGLLANSAAHENREFRMLLQHQVAAGLREQADALGKTLSDYAVWNEFKDSVSRTHPDYRWLSQNLTPSIYTNLDVDIALLLDPAERKVVYAIKFGQVLADPSHALPLSDEDWRWIDAAMRAPHQKARFSALALRETLGKHDRSPRLYFTAIQPVESEQGEIPPQHAKLLLFARDLDAPLLHSLSTSYLIRDPQVLFAPETNPARMSQPVTDHDGRPVAWLSWDFTPPGDALLIRLLPGAIILCLSLIGVGALLNRQARRLQRAEGELSRLSYHDHATGLPNRHKLRQHLDTVTAASHPGACVLLTLANLAQVAETYGPRVSERLITGLAARLDGEILAGEMVARLGEARFALWLQSNSDTERAARLTRLQHHLLQPLTIDELTLHPRFQIGVSLFPDDGGDAETLLQQAGSAMQQAARQGRQAWVRFNSGLSEARRQQGQLQMALRHALDLGQLRLNYQPFVDLGSGRIIGMEALLRWSHPQHGDVPPGVFIPLAEEDDALINSLGAWVLDEACAQIALWRRRYAPALFIAVNVSVRQMETPGFHHIVAAALKRHHLPADAIELELTENIAADSAPELEFNLSSLQRMGVSLAIDDFGTGYASFSYLRRFPAVRLKIDRQFFDGVPEDPQSSNLVKMIVALGHAMGAQVIGEGVERAEQVAFLKQIGGDIAQGYFFSKPLPPRALEALLAEAPYMVP
ncbi:MAG: EAL domain-containing protein [Paludibacterium sp.]|uniref:putative bifunctional diguanylate cyclase/phosphodiesterase n=1 Tax=Paludibacterium sp. TaxID=1917523 RepID=UPI0025D194AA|nr:EAL domain-containing protein [Paludibacterium sp.]MBV8048513.1 EAL domain-containing protein [Paludibacterium sp.]MBV8649398.1 EAL domain-containing protein [Paludibacterium sp.]